MGVFKFKEPCGKKGGLGNVFLSCKVLGRTCLLVLRLQNLPVGAVAELPHYFVALHFAATPFESSAPNAALWPLKN